MSSIQAFFANVVYPQAAINRAQGLVGAIQGLYTQIQVVSRVNVRALPWPTRSSLNGFCCPGNPLSVPNVTANYRRSIKQCSYRRTASPQTRDLIDMSDAAAQAAMKRAIAIDAIADTEMQAADRSTGELAQGGTGHPLRLVEAEAAAWLVRANAYTQSALGNCDPAAGDHAGENSGRN